MGGLHSICELFPYLIEQGSGAGYSAGSHSGRLVLLCTEMGDPHNIHR